jgi:hypothetical protein
MNAPGMDQALSGAGLGTPQLGGEWNLSLAGVKSRVPLKSNPQYLELASHSPAMEFSSKLPQGYHIFRCRTSACNHLSYQVLKKCRNYSSLDCTTLAFNG